MTPPINTSQKSFFAFALVGTCVLGACAGTPNAKPGANGGAQAPSPRDPLVSTGGDSNVGTTPGATPGIANDAGSVANIADANGGAVAKADGAGGTEPVLPSAVDAGTVADSICTADPFAASPLPAVPDVVELCAAMSFTEGPVWRAAEQALYFSDFKQNDVSMGRIMRYAPATGCVAHVMPIASNGLALALDGQLLACRHDDQSVATINPASGKSTTLIADYMGMTFRSPNDVTVRSDGTIYFTDPGWQLGSRTPERPEGFYRRSAAGELFAEEMLARANGITLSPDESTLYVSDASIVHAYDVAADGSLSNERMFANKSADGMVVDCAGNLYLTTGGNVEVYSAAGALLGTLDVPGGTTNVAFGGPKRTTLFITGDTKLHAVELLVPGFPF